ncbi:MAG TPA: DinB family protein [Planctomicrobium sp.]|nr:DinB family protein [Planctomicrobium sp.]
MSEPTPAGLSLRALLNEAFHGGHADHTWFLNPGDPGFIDFCRNVTAEEASTPPGAGRQTIAAHTRHIVYHLELISRILGGEQNAFQTADWTEAWKHPDVTTEEWHALLDHLSTLADQWIDGSQFVPNEHGIMLTGSMGSAVHFGYHLGSIRQILLQVRGK